MTDQTTPPRDNPETYAFMAREYERNVARIAQDLHEAADRIARMKAPGPDRETPGFGSEAAMLVSTVMNLLPNLGLGQVVHAAEQADYMLMHERLVRARSEQEG